MYSIQLSYRCKPTILWKRHILSKLYFLAKIPYYREMKIVILGAGVHGSYLASNLADEQHDVIIIDQDPKALAKVSRSADVATRLGSGTDWRVLEELTDLSPDLFIAMSSNDETNLVACTMAKNLGYPKTVARIRQNAFLDHSRLEFSRLFFVDHLLGTELAVAHELFKHIVTPRNLAIESFALGSVQMRTVVIPENFKHAGIPLSTLESAITFSSASSAEIIN